MFRFICQGKAFNTTIHQTLPTLVLAMAETDLHPSSAHALDPASLFDKKHDNFSAPPVAPGTIFYLVTAHLPDDKWELHGPAIEFTTLLPTVKKLVRGHPRAQGKLEYALNGNVYPASELEQTVCDGENEKAMAQKRKRMFLERGFTILYLHENDKKTEIRVIREVNAAAKHMLVKLPIYTVTRHGPLMHDIDPQTGKVRSGHPKGRAQTSEIVGSFSKYFLFHLSPIHILYRLYKIPNKLTRIPATPDAARDAASKAMDFLLASEKKSVIRTEVFDQKSLGGGIIMAMDDKAMWEVRIKFETDAIEEAKARMQPDDGSPGKGREWLRRRLR